ncbi:MAG: DoxX family membrane protein [Bacteroidales bacterium]|nr:DoxX family membrane protein [Bacteroidales bacterium]
MKNATSVVRIVLGVLIVFSGANKFGDWLNAAYMKDAMQFVVELSNIGAGFVIKAIGLLEILIGLALLTNKFTILATLALIPLIIGILVFHIFLDLKGIGVAVIVFVMNIFLLYSYKDNVSAIFKFNNQ